MASNVILLTRIRDLINMGRYEDAEFLINSAILKSKDNLQDELTAILAMLKILQKKETEAEGILYKTLQTIEGKENKSIKAEGIIYAGLALIELNRGSIVDSFDNIKSALELELDDNFLKVDILLIFSKILYFQGEFSKQKRTLKKIIEISNREPQYSYGLGLAYTYLAKLKIFQSWNGMKEINDLFIKAEKQFEICESNQGLSLLYIEMAYFYYRTGNLNFAKSNFNRAYNIAEEIDDIDIKVKANFGLSIIKSRMGNVLKALNNIKSILENNSIKENHYLRAKVISQLANLQAFYLQNNSDALEMYDKAAKLMSGNSFEPHYVQILKAGIIIMFRSNLKLSIIRDFIEEAANLAESHKSKWEEAHVLYLYGLLEEKEGHITNSLDILKSTLLEAFKVKDVHLALESMMSIVQVVIRNTNAKMSIQEIEELLNDTISFFEEYNFYIGIIEISFVQGIIFTLHQKDLLAIEYLEKAIKKSKENDLRFLMKRAETLVFSLTEQKNILPKDFNHILHFELMKTSTIALNRLTRGTENLNILNVYYFSVEKLIFQTDYVFNVIENEKSSTNLLKLVKDIYFKLTKSQNLVNGLYGPFKLEDEEKQIFIMAHSIKFNDLNKLKSGLLTIVLPTNCYNYEQIILKELFQEFQDVLIINNTQQFDKELKFLIENKMVK